MAIENIKYCRKCKRAFDFEKCPYCREDKLKEENHDKKRENIII